MKRWRTFTPYRDRPLCFIDVEGTGVKPGYHEVTEIGIRHTELGPHRIQVAPQHLNRADPESLKISKYNAMDWAEAEPFPKIAAQLTDYLEGATIVGHNICGYDIPMIQAEYESARLDHDALFRDVVDTMSLARVFLVPLGLNLLSLKACMKFIGADYDGAHSAYDDTEFAEKLYNYITNNLKWHGKKDGKLIQEALF